jgi:molybdenum cofactor guanylyltransferase
MFVLASKFPWWATLDARLPQNCDLTKANFLFMHSPNSPKLNGYVLAGGGSRRFGRDKALVEFGGVPLLLRLATSLRSYTTSVAVIGGVEKYAALDPQLRVLEDRWPGEGPLGGIITALENTRTTSGDVRWNVILSCDMPFVTADWLAAMVQFTREISSNAKVLFPLSDHGPEPLCACYRTDAVDELKSQFEQGVRKVTQALKQLSTEVLDASVWKRFDSAGRLFWNMNTPEDYVEAQRLWNADHGAR